MGEGVVVATGTDTEVGAIARSLTASVRPRSPLERELARLVRILLAVAAGLVIVTVGLGFVRGQPIGQNILAGVAAAIAAIPEEPPILLAVILGLESQAVSKLCQDAAENEVVAPANLNGAGQVVIAGSTAAVARAAALAKQRGAKRVLDVPVSAPFHCRLMEPAAEALKKVLWDIPVRPLRTGIITNVEADVNLDAERVKPLLIQQAVSPVRWEESVLKLSELGCERALEIGPGKVLKGLIKRIAPALECDNFDTPADLARIAAG